MGMKVLIVGGGGREHAIATCVAKSPKVDKIYCAPGNAGIGQIAECVPIGAMEFDKIVAFAKEQAIDLTIVGMDDPLVGGLVDALEAEGLRAFGPRKNAAILEGSKAFSKDLMKKYNIPTAAYENFDNAEEAIKYLKEQASFPIVLKADGLALGKGVLICNTLEEALAGVDEIMLDKKFGAAGNRMVIEEFMTGREVSVLSFVDGKTIRIMTSAQDHKRAKDGDQGLNTGGMGTFSPSPFYTEEVDAFCKKYIYQATVDAMAAEGRPFKGVIFFGLMLTPNGPKVLEYNARFGDPEAQVVLPRMKNDIIEVMEACVDGTLDQIDLQFEDNAAVCVVLASDGYPVSYEKGFVISGLENFDGKDGYYDYNFNCNFDKKPLMRPDGTVDYWSVKSIESVVQDQVIAEYHPCVEGMDGKTVTGKPIPAKRGREQLPLKGKGFERKDDNTYVALMSGKIETQNDRVVILPVHELSGNADLSSGNIDFHGDVVIHGSVESGVIVKASGTITVDGIVEACTLEAGKDIILRSGMLGGNKASVKTKGSITAKFFEFTRIECAGDIRADVLMDCQVQCFGKIIMNGKRGRSPISWIPLLFAYSFNFFHCLKNSNWQNSSVSYTHLTLPTILRV